MCDLGQGIAEKNWKRGLEQGLEQGMMKGREEGREEGIINTFVNNLLNMMEGLNLSIEQAMNVLKIPEADRPKYRELLGQP